MVKVHNLGNNVGTTSEGNASDLANFCTDESAHHVMHDAVLYQENMFPDCARNKMLSHYNRIEIGCFKDIFQSVDTNNLAAVLQASKELNFMLKNRAPELAAHYNMPLEPQQISARGYQTSSKHISTIPQLTTLNRASEEDPTPEVTNIIGTIDNHLHYQDTSNMQIVLILTFIPIKIEITIILVIMIVRHNNALSTRTHIITCLIQVTRNKTQ